MRMTLIHSNSIGPAAALLVTLTCISAFAQDGAAAPKDAVSATTGTAQQASHVEALTEGDPYGDAVVGGPSSTTTAPKKVRQIIPWYGASGEGNVASRTLK